MQDRYAGEVGDFVKVGLWRRWIAGEASGEQWPLWVHWYLTPDEARNADGKHVGYLSPHNRWYSALRACDPDLMLGLAEVVAHDPLATHETERRIGKTITYAASNYEALEGADALIVVTDWNEYRHPDFDRIKSTLRNPVVVDGRNLYDPEAVEEAGLAYYGIGRGRSVQKARS